MNICRERFEDLRGKERDIVVLYFYSCEIMQNPRFLTQEILHSIVEKYQTPIYVYSEKELRDRAREFLAFPSVFGHTVRYAMKANPQRNILKIFDQEGLSIDTSSDYEALRALDTGITPSKIQVSSQELGKHIYELIEK